MNDVMYQYYDPKSAQSWVKIMFDCLLICALFVQYCPFTGPINSVTSLIQIYCSMKTSNYFLDLLNFLLSVNTVRMEGYATMEGLTFTHEEGGVTVSLASNPNANEILDHCLIGKFLTDKPVRFGPMKVRIANLWRPVKKLMVTPLENNTFLFQLFHHLDVDRAMSDGPWSFDNHMLALRRIFPGEDPKAVPFNSVEMWVQIHNLPYGFMCKAIGELIGSYIGNFVEYDEENNWVPWRKFMRIKVAIDVNVPLKKDWAIRKDGGDWVKVMFKYERLGTFCFLCGIIGHTDKFCERKFEDDYVEGVKGWGNFLKSESGRSGGGDTDNRWLRDGRAVASEAAINVNNGQRVTAETFPNRSNSKEGTITVVNNNQAGALMVNCNNDGHQLMARRSGTAMLRTASGVIMRAPSVSSKFLLGSSSNTEARKPDNIPKQVLAIGADSNTQSVEAGIGNVVPKKRVRLDDETPKQTADTMKIDGTEATATCNSPRDNNFLFVENNVMAGSVDQACQEP